MRALLPISIVALGIALVASIGSRILEAGRETGSGRDDDDLEEITTLELRGGVSEKTGLSAVERRGDWMLLAHDEAFSLELLRRTGKDVWTLQRRIELIDKHDREDLEGDELDVEALCWHEGDCWALASHSLTRQRMDSKRSWRQNRERLQEIVHDGSRDSLFHFELDERGRAGPVTRVDLRPILQRDPLLGPFTAIPSKENGLDFEGMAWREGRLWLGLRGPVLRGNLAVVMVLDPEDPEDYELRFLHLKGMGFRSLSSVSDGFLGIAGPGVDLDGEHHLFHWTGEDGLPGEDRPEREVRDMLCELPSPKGGMAEGLSVLEEDEDHIRILIVHDGVEGGRLREYELKR